MDWDSTKEGGVMGTKGAGSPHYPPGVQAQGIGESTHFTKNSFGNTVGVNHGALLNSENKRQSVRVSHHENPPFHGYSHASITPWTNRCFWTPMGSVQF